MKKTVLKISILILIFAGVLVYFLFYTSYFSQKPKTDELFPAIKIGLVNGCGYQGVAANIADFLDNKNIDVVQVANARKFIYKETIIVVKQDDEVELKRLMTITGIKQVIYSLNETYPVSFLIIAGKDYQTYFADSNDNSKKEYNGKE
jgi:hypothetical protein